MVGKEVLDSILGRFSKVQICNVRVNFGPYVPRTFAKNKGEIVTVVGLKKILDF
jgi:hypothetical protein